jgi:hypothetical protein
MVLLSFSLIIFIHNCDRRLSQQQKKELEGVDVGLGFSIPKKRDGVANLRVLED